MKRIFFLILILIVIVACTKNEKIYYYYDDGKVFTESIEYDTITYITRYYNNGQKKDECYSLNSNNYVTGLLLQYYSDGFPKNKCEMRNGTDIKPQKMGKHSGYDITIDFGPYVTLDNGKCVRPFRTFVDGVSVNSYIVGIYDTSFCDTLAKKMPKVLKNYRIYGENDTTRIGPIEIEETLYPYYVDDLSKIVFKDSDNVNSFIITFFYPGAFNDFPCPNDVRMVMMHDSLNWEVVKFEPIYILNDSIQ